MSRRGPTTAAASLCPCFGTRQTNTIVNNELSEIIRMFNSAFDGVGAADGDYYPTGLQPEIDEINDRIYRTVNNGVYRAGFATSQEAYEEAFRELFETLDWLEARLGGQRFLMGQRLTEADWRLFTTLIRFDPVYFGHFKCNLREIRNYTALSRYLRELYHLPGIAETVDFFHIKHHYYESHRRINPTGIVPVGPELASLRLTYACICRAMLRRGQEILNASRILLVAQVAKLASDPCCLRALRVSMG